MVITRHRPENKTLSKKKHFDGTIFSEQIDSYKKEKHCLLEFLTAEEEHNTLKHLVNANGSDGKSLFHLVKELYVELDSTNFGKLISKFERCLLPCDFDLLKGFFEERMMSTCKRFTLKAIEECNKN